MKIELCISRDRVPYIVEEIGADRIVISEYNEDQDLITFEAAGQMDFLYMFHAGIRCGSEAMSKVLTSKVA